MSLKVKFLEKVSKKIRKEKHKELYRNPPLLEVIDLEKIYYSKVGVFSKHTAFKAISNVSLKLYEGETLGLVGESGCGKYTLGKAIFQFNKATSGTIVYR